MSVSPLVLQLVHHLTTSSDPQPRHFLLSARYTHPHHLPELPYFLSLLYSGTPLHTNLPLHYHRLNDLWKTLILSADLPLTLWMNAWRQHNNQNRDIQKSKTYKGLTEIIKPNSPIHKNNHKNINKLAIEARIFMQRFIEWLQSVSYFDFYFSVLNQSLSTVPEHLNAFLIQVQSSQDPLLTSEELKEWKSQMLTECQKLSKRSHQEEVLAVIYPWLREEIYRTLIENTDSYSSIYGKEVISKVIATKNQITGLSVVKALEKSILQVPEQNIDSFLKMTDEVIVSGNSLTAIAAYLTLVPSVFSNLISKDIKIPLQVMHSHLQLWKYALEQRQVRTTLLAFLTQWLPLLYHKDNCQKTQLNELIQLFRGQLLRIQQDSHIIKIKNIVEQLELQQIKIIYGEMAPYHAQIADFQESSGPQKSYASYHQTSKIPFQYQVSEVSQKSQMKSLMQSLRSSKSGTNTIRAHHQLQQLNIFSKLQTLIKEKPMQKSKMITDVDSILNLLQTLQSAPSLSLKQSQHSSKYFQSHIKKVHFLPVKSKDSKIQPSKKLQQKQEEDDNDPYCINNKGKVEEQLFTFPFVALRAEIKRKVIKNRGVIVNNGLIEMAYLIDSLYSRRRVTIFITFLRPQPPVKVELRQKSLRLCKKVKMEFEQPQINVQYKTVLEIDKVKMCKLQGVANSFRFIRPQIELFSCKDQQQKPKEVYQLPLYLYNLFEWLQIPLEERYIFDLPAELTTSWHPLCSKIYKNRQDQLSGCFPLLRLDSKGNICLKLRYLLQTVFAKVYFVMSEVKVVLINSCNQEVMVGIMEVLGDQEEKSK